MSDLTDEQLDLLCRGLGIDAECLQPRKNYISIEETMFENLRELERMRYIVRRHGYHGSEQYMYFQVTHEGVRRAMVHQVQSSCK